jgi:hypothetical protein
MPCWGGIAKVTQSSCFYCGSLAHIITECNEVQVDVDAGLILLDSAGRIRHADGSFILNDLQMLTIRQRAEVYQRLLRRQPDVAPPSSSDRTLLFTLNFF